MRKYHKKLSAQEGQRNISAMIRIIKISDHTTKRRILPTIHSASDILQTTKS
jgi:hypothetical protein